MSKRNLILLGIDSPIGLTIIRELGKNGISVHGLGWSEKSIGLYSRYLESGHIREKQESALIDQINQLAIRFQCDWIMTVSEQDILLLNKYKDILNIGLITPNSTILNRVLDKQFTLDAASEVGISTPKTWNIKEFDEIERIQNQLDYPLVLKWDNPHRVMSKLTGNNLGLEKYKYIHSKDELIEYLEKFKIIGEYPLIQEYCTGIGLGQMALMHKGKAILKFQHHRLAEWPPEGGFSTVCESIPMDKHAELMEKSISLLRKIDWSGPAMVEYRYDHNTQKAVLMEINGRFWGSLPLAHHANANFALAYYNLIAENKTPILEPYIPGIKCRFMLPEIKRIIRIIFYPEKIQNKKLKLNPGLELLSFISYFFSVKTHYYVFSTDDLKPFIMDIYFTLKKTIKL